MPEPLLGKVTSLWRYPIKSMIGETLTEVFVTEEGVLGDRALGIIDAATGKVASAKHPLKWPSLFEFKAEYVTPFRLGDRVPPVRITFPNRESAMQDHVALSQMLSEHFGRDVTLESAGGVGRTYEYLRQDLEGVSDPKSITEHTTHEGLFFDGAVLLVLTTATLQQFQEHHPEGRFDVARFRPNLVLDVGDGASLFPENNWVGKTLQIGEEVQVAISSPCRRCVMTTLPQGNLPEDLDILRTIVQHNNGNAGVRASVIKGGIVRYGDAVRLVG